jgi:hypothetical protein
LIEWNSCLESAISVYEKKYKLNRVSSSGGDRHTFNALASERSGIALKLSRSLSGKQDLLERILKHRSAATMADIYTDCATASSNAKTTTTTTTRRSHARGLREKNLNIIEESSNELLSGGRYLAMNCCSSSPININRKLFEMNKYLDQNNNLLSNTSGGNKTIGVGGSSRGGGGHLIFNSRRQVSNNPQNLSASLSSLALAAVKATQITATATMSKTLIRNVNERTPFICKELMTTLDQVDQEDTLDDNNSCNASSVATLTPLRGGSCSNKQRSLSELFTRKPKLTATSLNSSLNATKYSSASPSKCISSSIFNFNNFRSHFQK